MPLLIGIAGPSCAGKSVLAGRLAAVLDAPIVSLDSFYRDLSPLPFEERARTNFDVPDALDRELLVTQLGLLARGLEASVPIYDFTRHARAEGVHRLRAGAYAIVEGLLTLHWPEIRALLHTGVFVEAPDEVCLARRVERDVRERGRTQESVLQQYRMTVRPMAERYVLPSRRFADLVLDGTGPVDLSVAAVLARIR